MGQVQPEELRAVKGRKSQLAQQHGVRVEVHAARKARDQNHGQAEKGGKDQPNRRVLLDKLRAVEQFDQTDRQHADRRRAQQQPGRLQVLHDKEGQDDAQQDRMADGVRQHRHAAQHQEDARQRTRRRHDDGNQLNFE